MLRAVALALLFAIPATSGPARAEHVCRITGQVVRPCAGDLAAGAPSLERASCCDLRVTAALDAGVQRQDRIDPAPVPVVLAVLPAAVVLAPEAGTRDPRPASTAGPPLYLRVSSLLI